MDEITKALELIVDEYNFSNAPVPMVMAHLQLLNFFRTNGFWVALFAVKHDRSVSYEITYNEDKKTAVIVTYSAQNFVTVEE